MLKGIEPDQCFYIQNEAAIRGKKRLDLEVDPPPDLALEIEIIPQYLEQSKTAGRNTTLKAFRQWVRTQL